MNSSPNPRQSPAFLFYADDFLSGTSDMTAEEVGWYIRLLANQWTKGSVPNDLERLARMAGAMASAIDSPSFRHVVAKFSPCSDGKLRNKRLESVRDAYEQKSQKNSDAGKKGAEIRWGKRRNDSDPNGDPNGGAIATPMANGCRNDSFPSPSPSPKEYTEQSLLPKAKAEDASPWIVAHGVEMPAALRTVPCMDAIKRWLRYKSENRQSYKKTGLEASMTKWSKEFDSSTFPSAVEESIANGWRGIFPPRTNAQGSTFKPADKKEGAFFQGMTEAEIMRQAMG